MRYLEGERRVVGGGCVRPIKVCVTWKVRGG